jgi:M6 family metalloprotease-like protein
MRSVALLLATIGICGVLDTERASATESPAPDASQTGFELPQKFRNYTTRRGLTGMTQRALAARKIVRSLRGVDAQILAASPLLRETAVSGRRNIPVLMATFANTEAEPYDVADLQRQLFDGPWRTGTMTSYYEEISNGKFSVGGTVYPWKKLSQDDVFYEGGVPKCLGTCESSKVGELIKELVAANDAEIDFSQYDNDGPDGVPNSGDDDGYVDFIAIAHPERGGECSDNENIWSHQYAASNWFDGNPIQTNDIGISGSPILIDDYVIQPALGCNNKMVAIGVFTHEFGHAFGLPDLYDTDASDGLTDGAGTWCLMAGGAWGGNGRLPQYPTHMSAWAKEFLGWTVSTNLTENTKNLQVKSSADGNGVYRIDISDDEYYILDFRYRRGFDRSLMGEGLIVYKIKNSVVIPGMANNSVNAKNDNRGVVVVEADGSGYLDDGEDGIQGGPGDLFPGTSNKKDFDASTKPSSLAGIAICNIRRQQHQLFVDVYLDGSACPAPPAP